MESFRRTIGIALVACVIPVSGWGSAVGEPTAEGICVSWKATVRILFVGDEEAVGNSCEGQIQLKNLGEEKARVIVTVSPDSFDSGEPSRDEEVSALLGGSKRASIVFTSDPFVFPKTGFSFPEGLSGKLKLAGRSHPVTLGVRESKGGISVRTRVNLSDWELEAPQLAWGLVGEVRDSILLSAKVPVSTLRRLWESSL